MDTKLTGASDVTRLLKHQHQAQPPRWPSRARLLATYLVRPSSWIPRLTFDDPPTVRCSRRPDHCRCSSVVMSYPAVDEQDCSYWRCPVCGDSGFIRGWQKTLWDSSGMTSSTNRNLVTPRPQPRVRDRDQFQDLTPRLSQQRRYRNAYAQPGDRAGASTNTLDAFAGHSRTHVPPKQVRFSDFGRPATLARCLPGCSAGSVSGSTSAVHDCEHRL